MQKTIEELTLAVQSISISSDNPDKPLAAGSQVLLVFDPRMLLHVSPRQHPEQASRILSIFARLRTQGLLDGPGVTLVPGAFCDLADVLTVHTAEHVSRVMAQDTRTDAEAAAEGGRLYLDVATSQLLIGGGLADFAKRARFSTSIAVEGDTYSTNLTPAVALLAAGSAVLAVDTVVRRRAASAFAIIRPPGHHCHANKAGGFCFFNNVAIATRYAQRVHGVRRIAIVDWSVRSGRRACIPSCHRVTHVDLL
jgi:acetoin utilization deacetylase AcuC-like enzyme